MSAKSQTDAESDVDQPTTESDDVDLQRTFLVEATGTATKITRVTGSLNECEETEVSISRQAGTLGAFDAVYAQRDGVGWKENVVEMLLSEEAPENVAYEFHADEWDVQVDGRVDAFHGVIEALADPDLDIGGDPRMGDADYSRDLCQYHRSLTKTSSGKDDVFERLVNDCRRSPLFGPGAAIAKLDAKNAAREDLEGYAENLLGDVRENVGE